MEHLQHPSTQSLPPLKVPLLAQKTYDGPPWGIWEYPALRGYDAEQLLEGNFDGLNVDDAIAFCQEWLWFGLLQCSLRKRFPTTHFCYSDKEGRQWLDTQLLPLELQKYAAFLKRLDAATIALHCEKLSDFTGLAKRVLDPESPQAPIWRRSQEAWLVSFAIIVLIDTVCSVTFMHQAGNRLGVGELDFLNEPLRDQMVGSGWCRHTVTRLSATMPVSTFYLASRLRTNNKVTEHEHCTGMTCRGAHIDESKYETRHAFVGCNCDLLSIDENKLQAILLKGQQPLVKLARVQGKIQVSLNAWDEKAEYAAISHVWADGLGNTKRCGLQACQLLVISSRVENLKLPNEETQEGQSNIERRHSASRLRAPRCVQHDQGLPRSRSSERAMSMMDGFPLLWIDTLCVPRHRSPAKKVALSLMNATYSRAQMVLVIAADMISSKISDDHMENAMRIWTSIWTQRLWTLSEGWAASQMYFQFQDGALNFDSLLKGLIERLLSNQRLSNIEPGMSIFVLLLEGLWNISGNEKRTLSNLWNASQWRSTTNKEDEEICLALLLGFNPAQILSQPPPDRLPSLMSSLESVSSDLIFLQGRRLPYDGLRWAPATWFSRQPAKGVILGGAAPVTPEGISVQHPGLILEGLPSLEKGFRICFKNNLHTYEVSAPNELATYKTELQLENVDLNKTTRYAIILQDALSHGQYSTAAFGQLLDFNSSTQKSIRFRPLWTLSVQRVELLTEYVEAMAYFGQEPNDDFRRAAREWRKVHAMQRDSLSNCVMEKWFSDLSDVLQAMIDRARADHETVVVDGECEYDSANWIVG